jgi:hypothetical protein
MRNYLPVPSSWYIGLLAINFGAAGAALPFQELLAAKGSFAGQDDITPDADLGLDSVCRDRLGKYRLVA